jgi:hypothetical protein
MLKERLMQEVRFCRTQAHRAPNALHRFYWFEAARQMLDLVRQVKGLELISQPET